MGGSERGSSRPEPPSLRPIDTIPLGESRGGCVTCGEVFSTTANFDRHRVWGCDHDQGNQHRDACWDTRYCAEPSEVGLELKKNGVWAQPATPQQPVLGQIRASESTEGVG